MSGGHSHRSPNDVGDVGEVRELVEMDGWMGGWMHCRFHARAMPLPGYQGQFWAACLLTCLITYLLACLLAYLLAYLPTCLLWTVQMSRGTAQNEDRGLQYCGRLWEMSGPAVNVIPQPYGGHSAVQRKRYRANHGFGR